MNVRQKGAFRKQGLKPLVGDQVEIDVLDEAEHLGNVVRILPRKKCPRSVRQLPMSIRHLLFCDRFSKTQSQPFGPLFGHDGLSGCAGADLL